MRKRNAFVICGLATVLLLFLVSANLYAISRGYISRDQDLKPGMVVAVIDNEFVERASQETVDKAIGIAQPVGASDVAIATGESSLLVAISGVTDVYATDYNGPITKGTSLSLSPIKGVLMKSGEGDGVFGTALTDMSTDGDNYTIPTTTGDKIVRVAKTTISLDRKGLANESYIEAASSLKKLGKALSGKETSEIRVAVAFAMFVLIMIAEGGIIYGAISGSMISVGRNPMAKDIIRKDLLQVVGVALIVLALGVTAVYVILRV